jgi:hypothetical protein
VIIYLDRESVNQHQRRHHHRLGGPHGADRLRQPHPAGHQHTLSFYSGDASEIAPGQISVFTYGGGGGYLYLTGPRVTGQVTTSYISLHGTATRKDILLAALGGASVTIGAAATPNQVIVSGDLYVSGAATVNGQLTVNGATVFYGTRRSSCSRSRRT